MTNSISLSSYISRQISQTSNQIRSKITDNEGKRYERRYLYDKIERYVDDYLAGRNTGSRWVCIPGFRGTGKTTVISQIWNHLSVDKRMSNINLLYVSMDEVTKLLDSSLYELIEEYQRYMGRSLENMTEKLVVMVDEAHYDSQWDTTVKTIIDRTTNIFFIVTGSSALSLQTGSDSARRISIKRMLPLTFRESCKLRTRKNEFGLPFVEMENVLFRSNDPKEVIDRIGSMKVLFNRLWSDLDPYSIEEYLIRGSLPFSMELPEDEDVFERTLQVLDKVIYEDIPQVESLNTRTLDKIWALITMLADSREISLDSLSNKLDLGKPTVHKMMRILEASEIIFQVRAYGSASKQMTKSPKYPFISPSIRASLKWKTGLWGDRSSMLGELLEDSIGMYLRMLCIDHTNLHLHHPSGKGEADYILTDDSKEKGIVIEVGYGDDKGTRQVRKTMKRISSRYGIVISSKDFGYDEDVIFVPLRYFFML